MGIAVCAVTGVCACVWCVCVVCVCVSVCVGRGGGASLKDNIYLGSYI